MPNFHVNHTCEALERVVIPVLVFEVVNFLMHPKFDFPRECPLSTHKNFKITNSRHPYFWIAQINGLDEMVQQIISVNHSGLTGACVGNHMKLIKIMLGKGMRFSRHKYKYIIGIDQYLYIKPPNSQNCENRASDNWNRGLELACVLNNRELSEFVISNGANDWGAGLLSACHGGNPELAQLMMDKGATNISQAMYRACLSGKLNCVKLVVKQGGMRHCELGLLGACRSGHLNVVKFLTEILIKNGHKTTDNLAGWIGLADKCGYPEIVEYLCKKV